MKYSIIIPCYNSEDFVLQPLTSLKNQTYKNIEIVIVNDGSTDKSEEIIQNFIKNNSNLDIKYKRIENSGPSKARNTALEMVTGDYICFLDSDDTFEETLFEEIEKVISDDIDCIYWGYDEHDTKGNIIFRYTDIYQYIDDLTGIEVAQKKQLRQLYVHTCTGLYKRSVIKDNNLQFVEGVSLGEDINFIYKALFHCKKVKVIAKELYHYLYREDSLMHHKWSDKYLTEFVAIRDLLDYIKTNNIPDVYDYMYSYYYYTRCTVCKTRIKSMKWHHGFKFQKFVRTSIPKVKKVKPIYLNKKQIRICNLYNFDKMLFFLVTKVYWMFKKDV